jgi:hypothetical protein
MVLKLHHPGCIPASVSYNSFDLLVTFTTITAGALHNLDAAQGVKKAPVSPSYPDIL